jgi:predicted dienelactone hydrolase
VALAIIGGLFAVDSFVNEPALTAQIGRGRIGEILRQRRQRPSGDAEKVKVAGLDVAVWRPESDGAAPLIVFSHGFTGCNTQSIFLMEALADAGYLVVAPNHQDAQCEGRGRGGRGLMRPEEPFRNAESWNENTHRDRQRDVSTLVNALRKDRSWNINWSRVGLVGHSLGGYTVLGLAGGWPSWKLRDVDAVLALSPYCEPFVANGELDEIRIPVMYQGGTRDRGITPTVKQRGGCFDKTSSPAVFVEFDGAGHFAWSEVVNQQRDAIVKYSVDFLDRYVRGVRSANPTARMAGVTDLKVK